MTRQTQANLSILSCVVLLAFGGNATAQDDPDFFEKKIRPLLVKHCLACHGSKKQESGLRLDTRKSAIKGGEVYGPAFSEKSPSDSKLLAVIRHEDDITMPPNKKLSASDIALFEQWLQQGAIWPDPIEQASGPSIAERWKTHWAASPPNKPRVPAISQNEEIHNPIDAFVMARLEAAGLTSSEPASPLAIIKRTYYTLIGLPPTIEQIRQFENEYVTDPNQAMVTLVDSLLASEHYGERWARHWMDIARYADTKGYVRLNEQTNFYHAWTYRDYLINAFNNDKPYNEFIREQLAADLMLDGPDNRSLAALGFLTLGRRFTGNQHDIIDDRIDVVTRGLLGITVTCARCHDHKFDPIPTSDYYALYGMFASTSEPSDLPQLTSGDKPKPFLGDLAEYDQKRSELDKQIDEYIPATLDMLRGDTTRYLQAVLRGRKEFLVPLPAAKGELRQTFVERWIEYLEGTQSNDHAVFLPWHLLRELPSDQFEQRSKQTVRQLSAKRRLKLNPIVLDTLSKSSLTSMNDVAIVYGKLLEDIHSQWQALVQDNVALTAFESKPKESLRQVLYGDDSPFAITPREALDAYLLDAGWNMKLSKAYLDFDAWLASTGNEPAKAHVLYDSDRLHEPHVFIRGNPERTGERVARAAPSLLGRSLSEPFTQGSGRLELAEAIAHPDNPLTARVLVNRIWTHHFGQGLVDTTSNFGLRASAPSHPELLDYLAFRFSHEGWSIKTLHRWLLTSSVWQQSSNDRPDARQVDPENRLLWRTNRRRVDFETYRDSLLVTSGLLNRSIGGRSIPLDQSDNVRRTVYGFINRTSLPPVLLLFGFPTPDAHSDGRAKTTVPQQSLYMMNSKFLLDQAKAVSDRAIRISGKGNSEDIAHALFQITLGRNPTETELAQVLEFIDSEDSAWHYVAHTLIQSNEFCFID